MEYLAGAGVVASLAGGIMGALSSSADRSAAQAALAQAESYINAVGAPPNLSYQIIYDQFKQAGILTPEVENVINQQSSAVANLQANPSLLSAQTNALNMLGQRAQTGLAPSDVAAYMQMRGQVEANTQGKQQQIMQQFQQQGEAGSGAQLAAELANAQSGTQTESQAATQMAGQASQNALSALSSYGQQAGELQQQEWNQNLTKAQAVDQMNQFNIANQLNVQQQNVAAQNQAQAANLAELQQVNDMNTQTDNQEKLREVQAQEQNWQDQLALATAKANAATGAASGYQAMANSTANMYTGMGAGLSTSILGAGNLINNSEDDEEVSTPSSLPSNAYSPSSVNYGSSMTSSNSMYGLPMTTSAYPTDFSTAASNQYSSPLNSGYNPNTPSNMSTEYPSIAAALQQQQQSGLVSSQGE